MSFARYLHENRTLHIDHRVDERRLRPGASIDPEAEAVERTSGGRRGSRGRHRGGGPQQVRFRHVKPAFAPSPFPAPLPYLEPSERR